MERLLHLGQALPEAGRHGGDARHAWEHSGRKPVPLDLREDVIRRSEEGDVTEVDHRNVSSLPQLGLDGGRRRAVAFRPEDKAIVEQSLRETDALDFADRPFQSISDGQRQRVLLARALCQQPELIVLDEPTSFLDIRYKLELLTILKRMVREEHLAVLMSLHELDLAARVSDTVVCVAGDRIDRVGPPSEIFTPDYIAALYRMEPGKYDPCFDSLEFVPGGAR